MDLQTTIQRLLSNEISVKEIIDEHLVILVDQDGPRPNADTKIEKRAIEVLVNSLRMGCGGRILCHYDPKTNIIRNGIIFRHGN